MEVRKPTKRDLAFAEVTHRVKAVAYRVGKDDGHGFSHAFLWAVIKVGKYQRRCLITGSLSYGNWEDVEAEIKATIPEVVYTWTNLD